MRRKALKSRAFPWRILVLVTLFATLAGYARQARADDLRTQLMQLGAEPCEDSSLTCVNIPVPLDEANPQSPRLNIRFAVSFASEESKGILVIAVGGPGAAGAALADSYMDFLGDDLTRNLDIVFFDQRGTGAENGIDCPKANLAFDTASISPEDFEAAVATARRFVTDCLAEMRHRDLLPYLATSQAIHDVEAFRRAAGEPKLWLYGESYGTQLVQQYAARYPDAVSGIILDGVVDLTLNAQTFYAQQAVTADRILTDVFKACDRDSACSADMGAPTEAVYDRLAAAVKAAPLEVDYPLASGRSMKRELTTAILESDSLNALYTRRSRSDFLRALAAGGRGNFIPLLRLGYQNLSIDPETLAPAPDPSWYGAAYYAVTCPDFGDGGPDEQQQVRKVLEQTGALAARAPRFGRASLAERLACAFWPVKGGQGLPPPFTGGAYPTLILNSTADPATPVEDGYSVFGHVRNGYMVTMEGGPHVIWGRGLDCPDRIVSALLLHNRKPESREQFCRQSILASYDPLTLRAANGTPMEIAQAVETELADSPEFGNWDGEDTLSIGCDFGGSVTAEAVQSGTDYTFKDCAWWPKLAISGEAISIDRGDGGAPDGMTLKIEISGAHGGKLNYRHDSTTQAVSLEGEFDGQPILPLRPTP
jgi:pimeloyl-ACP methyl ester carboxylesterase